MKLIAVNKSSDVCPYLVCSCKDYEIGDLDVLTILLDNAPYRTDGTATDDVLTIHPDNWDWVDEWPLDAESVAELKRFRVSP